MALSVLTFDVYWGNPGTSIFGNSRLAANHTWTRLPSRLSVSYDYDADDMPFVTEILEGLKGIVEAWKRELFLWLLITVIYMCKKLIGLRKSRQCFSYHKILQCICIYMLVILNFPFLPDEFVKKKSIRFREPFARVQ